MGRRFYRPHRKEELIAMYRACWRLVHIGRDDFSRLIILCLYDD